MQCKIELKKKEHDILESIIKLKNENKDKVVKMQSGISMWQSFISTN